MMFGRSFLHELECLYSLKVWNPVQVSGWRHLQGIFPLDRMEISIEHYRIPPSERPNCSGFFMTINATAIQLQHLLFWFLSQLAKLLGR